MRQEMCLMFYRYRRHHQNKTGWMVLYETFVRRFTDFVVHMSSNARACVYFHFIFVFAFCFFYFELFCIQTFPNTHTRFLPLYFWFCALFLSIFSLSNLQFHSSVSFRIPKLLPCLCCQLCVVLRALIQFIQISPLTLSVAGFCDAPIFYSIASERLYSPTLQSTEPFYS